MWASVSPAERQQKGLSDRVPLTVLLFLRFQDRVSKQVWLVLYQLGRLTVLLCLASAMNTKVQSGIQASTSDPGAPCFCSSAVLLITERDRTESPLCPSFSRRNFDEGVLGHVGTGCHVPGQGGPPSDSHSCSVKARAILAPVLGGARLHQ